MSERSVTRTSAKEAKVAPSFCMPCASVSPVRNTAASSCMVFCISTRIAAVPRLPAAWRSRSRRATARSPASFAPAAACRCPGRMTSAQRRAASRPKTTRSSSELLPRRLAPCTETQAASPIAIRPGTTALRIAAPRDDHLAVVVAGDAAHVVVHRRLHRDRRLGDVDAGEDARGLGNARQPLVDDRGTQVLEVQVDVVVLGAHAAALADLDRHGAADDVARGEVLGVRCVALHEALAARSW